MNQEALQRMLRAQVMNIMCHFDFSHVHLSMQKMEWGWAGKGVPSLVEIKRTAKRLLEDASRCDSEFTYHATGGLVAYKYRDTLSLSFEVASYTPTDRDEDFFEEFDEQHRASVDTI